MLFIKSAKPFETGLVGTEVIALRHGSEQPEGLSLIASIDHHYETDDKVHALAVAHLLIIDREHLESVHKCFLPDIPVLILAEEGVHGESTVQIFHDVMVPLALLTLR